MNGHDKDIGIPIAKRNTVKPQWLEHLWDHGNLFEAWVVQTLSVNHDARSGSKGNLYDFLHSNCMLSVLMSMHNIQFIDKKENFSKYVFL